MTKRVKRITVSCSMPGCNKTKDIFPCHFKRNITGHFRCLDHSNTIHPIAEETKTKMSFARKGKPNHWFGRKHSEEAKKKISETCKRKPPMSEETKRKMSESWKHRLPVSEETKRKMSNSRTGEKNYMYGKTGKNNPFWIGGGSYGHYAPLLFDEETRRDPINRKRIQVRCKFSGCREWFTPTKQQVVHRSRRINDGGSYFYHSDKCKQACSVFGKSKYADGTKPIAERHKVVDSNWREMILEKDSYQCVRCESTANLESHHINGVMLSPMLANDVDNGVTLCGDCHDWIHSQPGCYFSDYRRGVCVST